jgi:hypothetical protein
MVGPRQNLPWPPLGKEDGGIFNIVPKCKSVTKFPYRNLGQKEISEKMIFKQADGFPKLQNGGY